MSKKKHQLLGNFGNKVIPYIKGKIKISATRQGMSCKKAHEISTKLGVSPKIVGSSADMLGIKLNKCQLGLFGCTELDSFKTKLSHDVTPQIKILILKIENAGRLSCESAWWISEKLKLGKMRIAAACEIMGIKISKCQLGAF